jgi:predicted lipoprotein
MPMARIKGALLIAMLAAAALPGCKIVKTQTAAEKAAEAAKTAFNPTDKVDAVWESQAVPSIEKRASDFKPLMAAIAANPDDAGAKFGHREKEGTSPWTYVVKFDGKITAAETASRAGTIDVDIDGDGKADLKVQIGPAIRGTALRDSLDFVNFSEFKNQIEWAQFGKAFNEKVNTTVLASVPRDNLIGKTVKGTGAFPLPSSGQPPLVTPATLLIGQ